MLDRIKANIPNTITCLNLLSGVMACIFAFHYSETFGALLGFQWAFVYTGDALTLSPWAFVALVIPVMGALRLARFNIDTR